MIKAQVIRIISNQYSLLLEDHSIVEASLRGKLKRGQVPLAGDLVHAEISEGRYLIRSIEPRRNELNRPMIANVDQAMIVMSVREPDFSASLVDRLIFLISYAGIPPVIMLTKTDLADAAETEKWTREYREAGYTVLSRDSSPEELETCFKDKITVLCGQSGVGKSTLLNSLDHELNLPTQPISMALGRGKHTTRHTQLYPVYGGFVADTPGFSSLEFGTLDSHKLAECVPDFRHTGACRYQDCRHLKEPGCAVKAGVEQGTVSKIRYENYCAVIPLCDQIKEWEK